MASFMAAYTGQTYALLRIVFGFTFLFHGTQKLLHFPMPPSDGVPGFVIWVAGTLELVGGLLIMIGFMTSWAAFVCSGLMAAAYWMAHGMNAPLPIQNQGELSVLYCFAFLYVSARGSGMWSVDAGRGDG